MTSPSPELGDLSPFEKIPEIPARCAECSLAQSLIQEALAKRAIAQAILNTIYERPDEETLVEDLEGQPSYITAMAP